MTMTSAERQKLFKQKMAYFGKKRVSMWIENEIHAQLDDLSKLRGISKEKLLKAVLIEGLKACNVTTNTNIKNNDVSGNAVSGNRKCVSDNVNKSLKNNELETNTVSGNKHNNSNDVSNNISVKNNDVSGNSDKKLQFNLSKSKKIGIELRAKGLTANQIAIELAQQGYGNKRGGRFSKDSINKLLRS